MPRELAAASAAGRVTDAGATLAALCITYCCRAGRPVAAPGGGPAAALRRWVGTLCSGTLQDPPQLAVFAEAMEAAAAALCAAGAECLPRSELEHLLLAQHFNGFTIADSRRWSQDAAERRAAVGYQVALGLYPCASMFNHAPAASSSLSLQQGSGGEMCFSAARELAPGEELAFAYLPSCEAAVGARYGFDPH
eukprot:TRINITY_DN25438_c0_g1_i4.p6 TRINITY_DN25438_c0_g1~~TRINITY_DN25438_c0_g1_i4.p6  ORF type:complete len:194 (+),score=78.70 TRINITY_DN25438_c0_g1_i4:938-1519(+)